MFILKKGHQPGVYVPLRALFLVAYVKTKQLDLMVGINYKKYQLGPKIRNRLSVCKMAAVNTGSSSFSS